MFRHIAQFFFVVSPSQFTKQNTLYIPLHNGCSEKLAFYMLRVNSALNVK